MRSNFVSKYTKPENYCLKNYKSSNTKNIYLRKLFDPVKRV